MNYDGDVSGMEGDIVEAQPDDQHGLLSGYHQATFVEGFTGSLFKIKKREIEGCWIAKGLKFNISKWTRKEYKTIHENFKKWVSDHRALIGNPIDFALENEDASRVREVRELKLKFGFYPAICSNIFRTVTSIVTHYPNLLGPYSLNSFKRYTEEELERLKKLRAEGVTWNQIGKIMKRPLISGYGKMRQNAKQWIKLNRRQRRKLVKIMQKKFPELDLTRKTPTHVHWKQLGLELGLNPETDLLETTSHQWRHSVKRRGSDGKIRLVSQRPKEIPPKLLYTVIENLVAEGAPTFYGADWDMAFDILHDYVGGPSCVRSIMRYLMLRRYKLDFEEIGFPEAIKKLQVFYKGFMDRQFEDLPDVIKLLPKIVPKPPHHWVLDPILAHHLTDYQEGFRAMMKSRAEKESQRLRLDEEEDMVW